MTPTVSLTTLKKGLHCLEEATRKRKEQIQTQLADSGKISTEDENWLDNEANHVDEWTLIGCLTDAVDFNKAFQDLTPAQKILADKLRKLAYDAARPAQTQTGAPAEKLTGAEQLAKVSKKRKREFEESLF